MDTNIPTPEQQPEQPIDAAALVASVKALQAENSQLKAALVELGKLLHIEQK